MMRTAAEEAGLAALAIGREQVDDLDARLEHLRGSVQLVEGGRGAVDGPSLRGLDRRPAVHGFADDVEDAAQHFLPDGGGDVGARIPHFGAAHEAVGALHGDGAHGVLAQVQGDLADEVAAVPTRDSECLVDGGQLPGLETHVDNRANHL